MSGELQYLCVEDTKERGKGYEVWVVTRRQKKGVGFERYGGSAGVWGEMDLGAGEIWLTNLSEHCEISWAHGLGYEAVGQR